MKETEELENIGKMPLEKLRGARIRTATEDSKEETRNQSFEVIRIDDIEIEDHGENEPERTKPDASELQREWKTEVVNAPTTQRARGGGTSQLVAVRDVDNSPRAERDRRERKQSHQAGGKEEATEEAPGSGKSAARGQDSDSKGEEIAGEMRQREAKGKAKTNKPPLQTPLGPNTDNEEGLRGLKRQETKS